jgi:hypothetical protein
VITGIESQHVPIHAIYQKVAKFTGLDDPNYIRISECLALMLRNTASRNIFSELEEGSGGKLVTSAVNDPTGPGIISEPIEIGGQASTSIRTRAGLESMPRDDQLQDFFFVVGPNTDVDAKTLQDAKANNPLERSISEAVGILTKIASENQESHSSLPVALSKIAEHTASDHYPNINNQIMTSKIESISNQGSQQATASSLIEAVRTVSEVPIRVAEATGSAASAAVSPWVKVSTVAAVGGALGIGAANSGAAWKSANAAARSTTIADRNAAAAEQSAIAAVLNSQIAARKLDFDIAESQKKDNKNDGTGPNGSGATCVAESSTSASQPAHDEDIALRQGTPKSVNQLPSTLGTTMDTKTSLKASKSFKLWLDNISRRQERRNEETQKEIDNITRLQKERKQEKQKQTDKKAKNISWFKRRRNLPEGVSTSAEAELDKNLRAKRSQFENSGVTNGASGSSAVKHNPKGKEKAKDMEDADSELSSIVTFSHANLSDRTTGVESSGMGNSESHGQGVSNGESSGFTNMPIDGVLDE